MAKKVELLILDEPTAALNDEESRRLLDIMLDLKSHGITSIIISHKLNEISYVADSITVIRDGKTIETLEKGRDEFTEDRIIKGMVGRELTNRYPERHCEIGDTIFEIKDWNVYHSTTPRGRSSRTFPFMCAKARLWAWRGRYGRGQDRDHQGHIRNRPQGERTVFPGWKGNHDPQARGRHPGRNRPGA